MFLHVHVKEVTGMQPLSPSGYADPYLKMKIYGRDNWLESKVCHETLNPVFNEDFTLDVPDYGTDMLYIELWNKGMGLTRFWVGKVRIRISELPPGYVVDSVWPFRANYQYTEWPGQIHCLIQVAPKTAPRFQPAPFPPLVLRVHIFEARDIEKMDRIGKTDAYCLVQTKGALTGWETRVIDNCMTPVWDEINDVIFLDPNTDVLLITMRDKDPIGHEDMSTLEVPMSAFREPIPDDKWWDMKPVKKVKKGGKLRMSARIYQAPPQDYPDVAPGLVGRRVFLTLSPKEQEKRTRRVKSGEQWFREDLRKKLCRNAPEWEKRKINKMLR